MKLAQLKKEIKQATKENKNLVFLFRDVTGYTEKQNKSYFEKQKQLLNKLIKVEVDSSLITPRGTVLLTKDDKVEYYNPNHISNYNGCATNYFVFLNEFVSIKAPSNFVTDESKTILLNLDTNEVFPVNKDSKLSPFFDGEKYNAIVNTKVFSGTKGKVSKHNSLQEKREEIQKKMRELEAELRATTNELAENHKELVNKIQKQATKVSGKISYKEVCEEVEKIEKEVNKRLYSLIGKPRYTKMSEDFIILEEIRYPQEYDFGGSIYYEYDRTLAYHEEVFQKYISKCYPIYLKVQENFIKSLNKITTIEGFDFVSENFLYMGDKTTSLKFGISLKTEKKPVDSKEFSKLIKKISKLVE